IGVSVAEIRASSGECGLTQGFGLEANGSILQRQAPNLRLRRQRIFGPPHTGGMVGHRILQGPLALLCSSRTGAL
ncbi:MAG: hypothetical protein WCG92_25940, partial [Hyphomicrobiales bacterium]